MWSSGHCIRTVIKIQLDQIPPKLFCFSSFLQIFLPAINTVLNLNGLRVSCCKAEQYNKLSLTNFLIFLFAYILTIYFLNNVLLVRSLLSSRPSGWQHGSSFGVFIVVGACRCTYVRDYPPSLSHTLEIAHTGNSHRLCCLTVVFSFLFRVLFWLTKILSRNYVLRKTLYFIGEEMFTSQKK